jgi:hypothetical protein
VHGGGEEQVDAALVVVRVAVLVGLREADDRTRCSELGRMRDLDGPPGGVRLVVEREGVVGRVPPLAHRRRGEDGAQRGAVLALDGPQAQARRDEQGCGGGHDRQRGVHACIVPWRVAGCLP